MNTISRWDYSSTYVPPEQDFERINGTVYNCAATVKVSSSLLENTLLHGKKIAQEGYSHLNTNANTIPSNHMTPKSQLSSNISNDNLSDLQENVDDMYSDVPLSNQDTMPLQRGQQQQQYNGFVLTYPNYDVQLHNSRLSPAQMDTVAQYELFEQQFPDSSYQSFNVQDKEGLPLCNGNSNNDVKQRKNNTKTSNRNNGQDQKAHSYSGRIPYEWMHKKNGNQETGTQKKRTRQSYTLEQTLALEKTFLINQYISKAERINLSIEIKLSERQIKIWMQNRRMKEKKKNQAKSLLTTAASVPSSPQLVKPNPNFQVMIHKKEMLHPTQHTQFVQPNPNSQLMFYENQMLQPTQHTQLAQPNPNSQMMTHENQMLHPTRYPQLHSQQQFYEENQHFTHIQNAPTWNYLNNPVDNNYENIMPIYNASLIPNTSFS